MKKLIALSTLFFIMCLTACNTQKEVKISIQNNSGINRVSDTTWHFISVHADNCSMYYHSVNGELRIAHTVKSHL